jgi:hypothetical protein
VTPPLRPVGRAGATSIVAPDACLPTRTVQSGLHLPRSLVRQRLSGGDHSPLGRHRARQTGDGRSDGDASRDQGRHRRASSPWLWSLVGKPPASDWAPRTGSSAHRRDELDRFLPPRSECYRTEVGRVLRRVAVLTRLVRSPGRSRQFRAACSRPLSPSIDPLRTTLPCTTGLCTVRAVVIPLPCTPRVVGPREIILREPLLERVRP